MNIIKQFISLADAEQTDFKPCMKRPIPVAAVQINASFCVETLEGDMAGRKGDYLMRGVEDELYVCPKTVFEKSYEWLPEQESTWQSRLIKERDELRYKMMKLKNFIDIPHSDFQTLPENERVMLYRQYESMIAYRDILNVRLEK